MVGALSSAYGVDVEGGVDVAVMRGPCRKTQVLVRTGQSLSDGKRTRGQPSPVGEEGPAAPLRGFEQRQLRRRLGPAAQPQQFSRP
ncbi:hypothetical protein GCM10011428_72440 [Streptomyces violaceus]